MSSEGEATISTGSTTGDPRLWTIFLLGGLRAERGAEVVTHFRSQKIGALLAYLALFPQRSHTREELADLLWPDATAEAGRVNLRTALAALRRHLGADDAANSVLVTEGHTGVYLRPGSFTTDAAAFETALRTAERTKATAERERYLTDAISHYHGPLLPHLYESWSLSERDRLQDAYLSTLKQLSVLSEGHQDLNQALEYARRAISADPLREETNAEVIRLLKALGQTTAAHRHFETFTRLLEERLGMEPSPELRRLAEETVAPIRLTSAESAVAVATSVAPAEIARAPVPSPIPTQSPTVRLPLTLTRFFGREGELSQLVTLLMPAEGNRLVTLTGPGGSGKTRTAIEAARRLAPYYPGGICFVSLAELTDVSRLFSLIAEALELPRTALLDPQAQVVEYLNRQSTPLTLLVLDNFEQIVEEGAPLIQDLLARAAGIVSLVTSRQRLLIDGEREIPLAPLPIPSLPGTPNRLLEFSSVQLFVNRAQAVRPDFALNTRNAASVAELCAYLEGIPLAIELAAAWARTLTPAQIVERLTGVGEGEPSASRFDLLVSRRRNAPSRHAALRATVEWSYLLLPETTQRFFSSLSVFSGGWTLQAAEVVTGESNALLYLTELRERSLIFTTETPGPVTRVDGLVGPAPDVEQSADEMRFWMLETLREYAAEQATRDPERLRELQENHYRHFLELAEVAEPGLRGTSQIHVIRALDRERGNVRVALERAMAPDRPPEDALRLAEALRWYWTWRSHIQEGRAWLERALERAQTTPLLLRSRAHQGAGVLTYFQTDYAASLAHTQAGLELAQAEQSDADIAFCYFVLGLLYLNLGQLTASLEAGHISLRHAEAVGDPWLIARPLIPLTWATMATGNLESATSYNNRNIELLLPLDDQWELANALMLQGGLRRFANDLTGAAQSFQQTLRLCVELDYTIGIAWAISGLAGVAIAHGDPARGVRFLGASGSIFAALHATLPQGWPLFQRDMENGKAALDEEGFAAALKEGEAMSIEQAANYALEDFAGVRS